MNESEIDCNLVLYNSDKLLNENKVFEKTKIVKSLNQKTVLIIILFVYFYSKFLNNFLLQDQI